MAIFWWGPPNGDVECKGVWKITIFDKDLTLSHKWSKRLYLACFVSKRTDHQGTDHGGQTWHRSGDRSPGDRWSGDWSPGHRWSGDRSPGDRWSGDWSWGTDHGGQMIRGLIMGDRWSGDWWPEDQGTDHGGQMIRGLLLLLVCVSFTIIGQPRNSVLIRRV